MLATHTLIDSNTALVALYDSMNDPKSSES